MRNKIFRLPRVTWGQSLGTLYLDSLESSLRPAAYGQMSAGNSLWV